MCLNDEVKRLRADECGRMLIVQCIYRCKECKALHFRTRSVPGSQVRFFRCGACGGQLGGSLIGDRMYMWRDAWYRPEEPKYHISFKRQVFVGKRGERDTKLWCMPSDG